MLLWFKDLLHSRFTAVYLVAKPVIWGQAEVDHVVIKTST